MAYQAPKKIVIIDDDVTMNAIVGGYLKAAGYEVYMSGNPDHALNLIRVNTPDMIILDRHLGQVDGTELLAKIRALREGATTPVLMLTGETRKEEVVKAIQMGASDYLAKPFVPQDLLAKVQKLLDAAQKKSIHG